MTEIILSDISENKRVPRIKKAPRHIGRGRPLRQAGRRDELDGNLPPPPCAAVIDKDTMSIQFFDLFNFMRSLEILERELKIEYFAEVPGNIPADPVADTDKDIENEYPINDNVRDSWSEDDSPNNTEYADL